MSGIVVSLGPERRKIVESEPEIVHDLADRSVKVPGRLFFDALRMLPRLRARRVPPIVLAALEGKLGQGIGEKGEWSYGRPHVIDGEDLGRLADALASIPELETDDPDEDDPGAHDDAFLLRFAEMTQHERSREGAVLVHVS